MKARDAMHLKDHETQAMALDVRLMNITTAWMLLLFAVACLGVAVMWVARHPVFNIQAITVRGDLRHNNAMRPVRLRRRLDAMCQTVDLIMHQRFRLYATKTRIRFR